MSQVEQVYNKLAGALPDKADTTDVVCALGMLLSTVIIEHARNADCRVKAAKSIAARLIEACETVPSLDELANGAELKPRYLN